MTPSIADPLTSCATLFVFLNRNYVMEKSIAMHSMMKQIAQVNEHSYHMFLMVNLIISKCFSTPEMLSSIKVLLIASIKWATCSPTSEQWTQRASWFSGICRWTVIKINTSNIYRQYRLQTKIIGRISPNGSTIRNIGSKNWFHSQRTMWPCTCGWKARTTSIHRICISMLQLKKVLQLYRSTWLWPNKIHLV